ncbi:hypothetical protein KCM76_22635 [Zooshikella marina]|uniref:hypothetical protein n=1 Tax=Zooshikella ganghwensis TaxID=202772 RepID=UPI001BAE9DC6|nr:hypothetical protein [Zooshikella ganghwensis]MBU2708808.1 hypothetical protein [Zooshikella ganghwensis]
MKIANIPLVFTIFLLVACDAIDPKDNKMAKMALIGTWKGQGHDDNEKPSIQEYWKATRHADGRYDIEWLILDTSKNTYEHYKEETGQWHVNDGFYTEKSTDNEEIKHIIIDLSNDYFCYNEVLDIDHTSCIQEERVDSSYNLKNPPSGYSAK